MDEKEAMMEITNNELTEIISINVICRLCANQNDKLIGIYSEDGLNNDLANKMNLYLPIKVNESDDLPLQCCWQCASTVLAWHELVITSVEADRRLRSYQFVTEKLGDVQVSFEPEERIQEGKEDEFVQNSEDVDDNIKQESIHSNNSIFNGTEVWEFSAEDIKSSVTEENRNVEKVTDYSKKVTEYQMAVNIETKTCELCDEKFSTKISLKKHMRTIHNIKEPKYRRKKSEIEATFICPECSKSFTRKFDMQRHIVNKHPNQSSNLCQTKRIENMQILEKCKIFCSEGNYYKCDICGHRFKQSHSLIRHRKVHISEKLYCCHICGKNFSVSSALKRHINQLHHGIKNFECNICERKFSTKVSRDQHMNIHTNNRPFVCDLCGKSFRQSSSLHIHKMFHTNIFRFSCNICSKKFRRKQDLKVHYLLHTGEKPYRCKTCEMSFRLVQDLNRHLKVHANYYCTDCGLTFHQERFLKMHKKMH